MNYRATIRSLRCRASSIFVSADFLTLRRELSSFCCLIRAWRCYREICFSCSICSSVKGGALARSFRIYCWLLACIDGFFWRICMSGVRRCRSVVLLREAAVEVPSREDMPI